MTSLTNREAKIVAAFASTLITAPIDISKLCLDVDDHLRHFPSEIRLAFRAILILFDYGAVLYRLHLRTFRQMNQKWRERYLSAWHHSTWAPKRALWKFLTSIVYMNYYSDPANAEAIGYTPRFKRPKPQMEFPHENACIAPLEHDVKEECDVCIIGSGAGGAAAAKVLSEAGRKVIIIEEGGYYSAEDFGQDPVSMIKLLYRNGGIINTFGWPAILVPLGKCVGGTTTINSGTCFRTPSHVLERWARDYGLSTWTSQRLARHFKEVEETLHVEVASNDVLKRNTQTFKRGLEALGFEGAPLPRNAPDCKGSGVCCFGCPTNAKNSTNLSYVPLALKAGARLYAHCQVSRFLYSGTHASTVIARFRHPETQKRMGTLEVKARVIIVACGTFHTPAMLMRSHVPNISGQIGHNLTLHPAAKVFGLFDEEIRGWDEIPQGYYMDALANEGVMLEGIFLPPAHTAPTLLRLGKRHREIMENFNHIATFGMMVSDTSRGRILRIPGGRPVTIYNINRQDLPKYVRGITLLCEAFFAAGATRVFLPIHTIPELSREEGPSKICGKKIHRKDLDLQAFHPLGTCRMGADPKEAVCDPCGRLYGLDNVFLADGSIFPTSLGVNPMMTIMAAASKIAEYVDREVL